MIKLICIQSCDYLRKGQIYEAEAAYDDIYDGLGESHILIFDFKKSFIRDNIRNISYRDRWSRHKESEYYYGFYFKLLEEHRQERLCILLENNI
jgi:hypothetical protein